MHGTNPKHEGGITTANFAIEGIAERSLKHEYLHEIFGTKMIQHMAEMCDTA